MKSTAQAALCRAARAVVFSAADACGAHTPQLLQLYATAATDVVVALLAADSRAAAAEERARAAEARLF